ncbi:HD domain-containing protein [Acidiferrimicrobium sp. IK]|uniref:HD domain-containing protein n=1 Tax=Acidiferrimicrobium sp. IK TaxID=2871700 RepID=UPI0039670FF9
MAGTTAGAVRRAHSDPTPGVGAPFMLGREEREAAEDAALAAGASRAIGAGRRAVEEEPDDWRTCFERDRDRILHSAAFRRLAGKTQVFVHPADHQRTRLTHALEVAQVATAIARALRLNVALVEAIALGHDCGHGPGGHASEDALGPYVAEGYDHAVWGADVVLAGLNLCAETLDGVRCHSWSRPAPMTAEGEVVSWADRIAYVCHDFEDAVAAGIVDPGVLPADVLLRCGETRREQLDTFVRAVVTSTARDGHVSMDADTAEALAQMRAANYRHIYMRPASVAQASAVIAVLRALVEHFADHPGRLPGARADGGAARAGSEAALRAAVTYVGGMTDRFAFRTAVADLGWDPARLPVAVDAG